MSTAVEAATAATMEVTTSTVVAMTTAAVVATTAAVKATTYIATAASPSATVVIPALTIAVSPPTVTVPGASADEHAAVEPLRTIEAIGCTGVGRVSIVTVRTYGRGRNVRVTPADVNSK